jgi:hypothetical protein
MKADLGEFYNKIHHHRTKDHVSPPHTVGASVERRIRTGSRVSKKSSSEGWFTDLTL